MDEKKTRLDEGASIYAKREEKTEKQKWSELHGKERWQYFKDYYLVKLLVTCLVVGLAVSLLYTIFSPKPDEILKCGIANYSYLTDRFNGVADQYMEHLGLDTEKEVMQIDVGYTLPDDPDSVMKLSTMIASNNIDILITNESAFLRQSQQGSCCELTDVLPSDLFARLSDKLVESNVYDYDISNEIPKYVSSGVYGVYLDSLSIFEEYAGVKDRPVFGIIINAENKDKAVDFLDYLFRNYGK